MDSMKVLLGVTFALLLMALGFAYTQGTGRGEDPMLLERIEKLEVENEELETKINRLEGGLDALLSHGQIARPARRAVIPQQSELSEADRLRMQEQANRDELKRSQEELARREMERREAEARAALQKAENDTLARELREQDKPGLREKRLLVNSNAVGFIQSWSPSYGIAGISLIGDPGLKAGDILAIRRGTKAIGQVQVSEITVEGVTAKIYPPYRQGMPIPEFKEGDEAIFTPRK